jgi:hypothetical protein
MNKQQLIEFANTSLLVDNMYQNTIQSHVRQIENSNNLGVGRLI